MICDIVFSQRNISGVVGSQRLTSVEQTTLDGLYLVAMVYHLSPHSAGSASQSHQSHRVQNVRGFSFDANRGEAISRPWTTGLLVRFRSETYGSRTSRVARVVCEHEERCPVKIDCCCCSWFKSPDDQEVRCGHLATQTPQLDSIGLWRFVSCIDNAWAPAALARLNGRPNYNGSDCGCAYIDYNTGRQPQDEILATGRGGVTAEAEDTHTKRPYRLTHKRPFRRDVVKLDLISVAGDAETGATQIEQLARVKSRGTHLKTGETGEPLRPESYRQMR